MGVIGSAVSDADDDWTGDSGDKKSGCRTR